MATAAVAPARSLWARLFRDGRHPHLPLWSAGTIWIYDSDRHPVNASQLVKHRKCADMFTHNIIWFLLFLSFAVEVVVSVLTLGAVPYYYASAAFSGAMWLCVLIVGEWPVRRGSPLLSYAYMVGLYWMWITRIWTVAMCYISIEAGQVRRARQYQCVGTRGKFHRTR